MEYDLFSLPTPARAPKSKVIGRGIPLRFYQREDVDALMCAIEGGAKRPCCVGATGIGKGAIAAESVGRLMANGKVVCLVDRAHLVHQLADEIERHLDITTGRVADGSCLGLDRQIVVSTVQAMYTPDRNGKPLYKYRQFDNTKAVIADEAHRFFADCYKEVLNHFVDELGAVCPMLTATPVPSNGSRWEGFVDWTPRAEGPCMRTIQWCVRNGYLVKPIQAFVKVDLDLASIYQKLSEADPDSVSDSEDDGDELSGLLVNMLNDKGEKAAATFAAGICDVIGSRQAIIFSPARVKAAQLLAAWIQATGRVSCEAVWGSRIDKFEFLDGFKRGSPQCATSVNLLSDGWNGPGISAVFMCRFLKEWRVITQMVGRGLRPAVSCISKINALDDPDQAKKRKSVIENSEKPDCLVADLAGIDGKIFQASAVEVLYANESEDVRHEIAEILSKPPRKEREEDQEIVEDAKEQLLQKQNERLSEMARKRAMAGALDAQVSIVYDDAHVQLPEAPTPNQNATIGEQARFIAHACANGMSLDKAKHYAATKPRSVIRGWTNSEFKKLGDKRPNWNAARMALPGWKK